VLLGGADTSTLGRRGRARLRNDSLGFVFQFHHLLPEFSVWENLTMPALLAHGHLTAEERSRGMELLRLLGMEGLGKKRANAISGGQKQRVAIGRALMNQPRLILADEPTGNLDTANSAAVYALFREISRSLGTAFLIVTHDRSIAEQTDRILEVRDGTLVQDVRNEYGPPAG